MGDQNLLFLSSFFSVFKDETFCARFLFLAKDLSVSAELYNVDPTRPSVRYLARTRVVVWFEFANSSGGYLSRLFRTETRPLKTV